MITLRATRYSHAVGSSTADPERTKRSSTSCVRSSAVSGFSTRAATNARNRDLICR